ncbi:MAG: ATP-binding cassette domain-containing protein [Peptococcaceae bacterium]|nr:ATP-binding cassette domain-containing protein [Peptococcaceae bacterium]
MSVVVKAEHLSCQSGRRYLIHDINWEIEKGDHWIVFGMNGCGKTTLLSIIAGFKGETAGKLEVFGEAYNEKNIFSHRKRIGWVSSSFFDKYLSWESAMDIVLSGVSGTLSLSKDITNDDVKRAKLLLKKLRLGNKMAQPFALMSKGERQCVLIARALISNPEILILDEPGTGLDIYAREYVLQAIADLAETTDMTIIYVTHYVEEILPMFDKTILMKDGYIVDQGKTGEMFDNDSISRLLGYPVVAAQDAMGNVRVKLEVESTFRDLYDTMNKEEEA